VGRAKRRQSAGRVKRGIMKFLRDDEVGRYYAASAVLATPRKI